MTRRNWISLSITLVGMAWVVGVLLHLSKGDWPDRGVDGSTLVELILLPLILLGALERFLNRTG